MSRIERAETWLIEVPTRRPHKLSFGEITSIHHVVLRLTSTDGVEGWGEATVPAGPTWSEESAESIFSTLNRCLLPLGRLGA